MNTEDFKKQAISLVVNWRRPVAFNGGTDQHLWEAISQALIDAYTCGKESRVVSEDEIEKLYSEYVYSTYPKGFYEQKDWELCKDFKAGFRKAMELNAVAEFPKDILNEAIKEWNEYEASLGQRMAYLITWLRSRLTRVK